MAPAGGEAMDKPRARDKARQRVWACSWNWLRMDAFQGKVTSDSAVGTASWTKWEAPKMTWASRQAPAWT